MKTKRSFLVKAINKRFLPILFENGFIQHNLKGKEAKNGTIKRAFPFGNMKRPNGKNIELLDIQMDKGGKLQFVINFGIAPPEGVIWPWGKLTQNEITASGAPEHCRLYDSRFYCHMRWFSVSPFPYFSNLETRIDKTVNHLIELYPEVEEWFKTQKIGPHIKCVETKFS